MKGIIKTNIVILLLCITGCSPAIPTHLEYIGAQKPSISPIIFCPEKVSKDSIAEFGSIFNKKGDHFFYAVNLTTRAEIRSMENKKWSLERSHHDNI